jgi:hypothetical protein
VPDSFTSSPAHGRADTTGVPPIRIVEVTSEGMWRVRVPGSQRASAVLDTQGDAEARASEILRRAGGGELRVFLTNGEIINYTVVAAPAMPGRRQITRQPRGARC